VAFHNVSPWQDLRLLMLNWRVWSWIVVLSCIVCYNRCLEDVLLVWNCRVSLEAWLLGATEAVERAHDVEGPVEIDWGTDGVRLPLFDLVNWRNGSFVVLSERLELFLFFPLHLLHLVLFYCELCLEEAVVSCCWQWGGLDKAEDSTWAVNLVLILHLDWATAKDHLLVEELLGEVELFAPWVDRNVILIVAEHTLTVFVLGWSLLLLWCWNGVLFLQHMSRHESLPSDDVVLRQRSIWHYRCCIALPVVNHALLELLV